MPPPAEQTDYHRNLDSPYAEKYPQAGTLSEREKKERTTRALEQIERGVELHLVHSTSGFGPLNLVRTSTTRRVLGLDESEAENNRGWVVEWWLPHDKRWNVATPMLRSCRALRAAMKQVAL